MQKAFLSKTVVGDSIEFKLGNDLKVVIRPVELSEEIREHAMFHGLRQKIGDAAAGFSKANDFTGAFGAMQQVADNLLAGTWNAKGGGGSADVVAALAKLQKMDEDTAAELVASLSEAEFVEVCKHPDIKAEVKRLQAERAKVAAKAADAPKLADILAKMKKS